MIRLRRLLAKIRRPKQMSDIQAVYQMLDDLDLHISLGRI